MFSQVCINYSYIYCFQEQGSYVIFYIVQEHINGVCQFLVNDCEEYLPHWKQLATTRQ